MNSNSWHFKHCFLANHLHEISKWKRGMPYETSHSKQSLFLFTQVWEKTLENSSWTGWQAHTLLQQTLFTYFVIRISLQLPRGFYRSIYLPKYLKKCMILFTELCEKIHNYSPVIGTVTFINRYEWFSWFSSLDFTLK